MPGRGCIQKSRFAAKVGGSDGRPGHLAKCFVPGFWPTACAVRRTPSTRIFLAQAKESLPWTGEPLLVTTDSCVYHEPEVRRVFGPTCVHVQVENRHRRDRILRTDREGFRSRRTSARVPRRREVGRGVGQAPAPGAACGVRPVPFMPSTVVRNLDRALHALGPEATS